MIDSGHTRLARNRSIEVPRIGTQWTPGTEFVSEPLAARCSCRTIRPLWPLEAVANVWPARVMGGGGGGVGGSGRPI